MAVDQGARKPFLPPEAYEPGWSGGRQGRPAMGRLANFLSPSRVKASFRSTAGSLEEALSLNFTFAELARDQGGGQPYNPAVDIVEQGRSDLFDWLAAQVPAHFQEPAGQSRPSALRAMVEAGKAEMCASFKALWGEAWFNEKMLDPKWNGSQDSLLHLIVVVERGSLDSVRRGLAIIDAIGLEGRQVDARNGEGMTALMLAAQKQNCALCQGLIERGADAFVENALGQSATNLAREWASLGDGSLLPVFERLGLEAFLAERGALGAPSGRKRSL